MKNTILTFIMLPFQVIFLVLVFFFAVIVLAITTIVKLFYLPAQIHQSFVNYDLEQERKKLFPELNSKGDKK